MKKNLNAFERLSRMLLGAALLFVAKTLFEHTVVRLGIALVGIYVLIEAISGVCPYFARALHVRSEKDQLAPARRYLLGLVGIQVVFAYEWWTAGWEKIWSGTFVSHMPTTIAFFASKNPFPWYQTFLTSVVMPNATVFGYVVEWTELVIGSVLAVTAFIFLLERRILARRVALVCASVVLVIAMVLLGNFYLATSAIGPSERGINVIAFWAEAVLAYTWLALLFRRELKMD